MYKYLALIFSLGVISTSVYSQRSSDIGLLISTSASNRVILEYRIPFEEKYHFKAGLSYGASSNPFYTNGKIITASDSSVTQRFYNQENRSGKIRLGVDRQLGESYFSLGMDVLLGYTYKHQRYTNKTAFLNDSGEWQYPIATTNFLPMDDPTSSRVTRHFFTTGIQFGAEMSIPVGDRFFVSLGASAIVDSRFILEESEKIDPYNEFSEPTGFNYNFESLLNLGLRYRFGKEYSQTISKE